MHKNIILLLITTSLCVNPIQKIHAIPQHNPQSLIQNKHVKNGLRIAALFAVLWLTAPEEIQKQLNEQIKPNNLIKNFLTEFSSQVFATFCHEQGHALTAEYFTGKPTEVHLGANSSSSNNTLYKAGNIHIDGFDPRIGYTKHAVVNNKLEKSIVLLSGGAGGLVGHHLFKFVATYLLNLSQGKDIALTKSVKAAKKLDHISFRNIFNALLPIAKQSDASIFWRDCVGVDADLIDLIIAGSEYIMMAICSWYYSKDKSGWIPIHTDILHFYLNYYLSGYLHIEVEPI